MRAAAGHDGLGGRGADRRRGRPAHPPRRVGRNPLFSVVGEADWPRYHAGHTQRTGWAVAPMMLAELGSAAVILLQEADALAIAGLALAAATWLFTFGLAVPDHGRLDHGFDARVARRLVTVGWLRTAAWTGHGVVALALLQAR